MSHHVAVESRQPAEMEAELRAARRHARHEVERLMELAKQADTAGLHPSIVYGLIRKSREANKKLGRAMAELDAFRAQYGWGYL